jgi:hypothetical protein
LTSRNVEPYIRADGTKIWSLMQLERQLRPQAYGGAGAATSTSTGPDFLRARDNPGDRMTWANARKRLLTSTVG